MNDNEKASEVIGIAVDVVQKNGYQIVEVKSVNHDSSRMGEIDTALNKWLIGDDEALLLIEFFGRAASYGFDVVDLVQEVMPRIQKSGHSELAIDLMMLLVKYQQGQRNILWTAKEGGE